MLTDLNLISALARSLSVTLSGWLESAAYNASAEKARVEWKADFMIGLFDLRLACTSFDLEDLYDPMRTSNTTEKIAS